MELFLGLVVWIAVGLVLGRGFSGGFVSMRLSPWLSFALSSGICGGVASYMFNYAEGLCIACICTGIVFPLWLTVFRLRRAMPQHFTKPIVRRMPVSKGFVNVAESVPEVFGNRKHGWLLVYPGVGNTMRYSLDGRPLLDEPDPVELS